MIDVLQNHINKITNNIKNKGMNAIVLKQARLYIGRSVITVTW